MQNFLFDLSKTCLARGFSTVTPTSTITIATAMMCLWSEMRCRRAVAVADQDWVPFTFRDPTGELLQVEPGSKSCGPEFWFMMWLKEQTA
jgi:hypothetical protein